MKIFLDTSSLIKLYHYENGTDILDRIFEENIIHEVFLSDIAKVEFVSAIWKKVRTKDLTDKEAQSLISSFAEDYDNYHFIDIDSELVLTARDLIGKYGLFGLRTLDSLQLASVLKVKSELTFALTSDDLLKSLIKSEGLTTR
jgi:uncharacterized protein